VIGIAAAGAVVGFVAHDDGGTTTSTPAAAARTLPAVASATPSSKAGQTRAEAIYAAASPAVVSIRTTTGSGTGFLVDGNGTLVTNAHVVDGARTVTVHFGDRGAAITGTVVGTDPSDDVAVVRIPQSSVPSGVKPLAFADSGQVTVGETVVAIGNPFGLDRTLTEGIVSAVNRDIQSPNGFEIPQAIQTDAAINPGNSGGPLLDDSGHVIGVNSQIETGGSSQGNVGIGFAVPSNTVRRVVPTLEDGGTVTHPWLGVSTTDAGGSGGARVAQVVGGSPAAAAGLRAGDVVTAIGGAGVSDSSSLSQIVGSDHPGDKVTLRVLRDGRTISVDVTLRTRPAQAP
jgi:putative serine protease PepD